MESKIEKLIVKFMTKSISADELETLSEWIEHKKNRTLFYEYIKINYAVDAAMSFFNKEKAKLMFSIHTSQKSTSKQTKRTFWKYAIAATIALLLSLPFAIQKSTITKGNTPTIKKESTIVSGSNKAVLTLENGKQVALEKGKNFSNNHVNSDGKNLIYTKNTTKNTPKKEVVYNYLTIPRGGQFFVELSDGTKVWLNSESKLKYPVAFNKNETRKVELLYGEAYFEVAPSVQHNGTKFTIKTKVQDIEVMGTEFNIKSYKEDETIATTLVEGKVFVSNGISNITLQPGQQSRVNMNNDKITTQKVNVSNVIAWKNGEFRFKNKPLHKMLTELGRWYDLEIVFENKAKKETTFSGSLKRSENVKELLDNIERTGSVKFEIHSKKIIIK